MSVSPARDRTACDRAATLWEQSLSGPLVAEDARFLQTHLAECPACRDAMAAVSAQGPLWSALDSPEGAAQPPAQAAKQAIQDHLAGQPVMALDLGLWQRVGILLIGFVATSILLGLMVIRADREAQGWWLVDAPAMGWMALFAAGALVFGQRQAEHGRRGWRRWALMGAVVATFAASTFVVPVVIPATGSFVMNALSCISIGTTMSLISIVPAVVWARRGMAGPSRKGALFLGVMAGAMGIANLQIHCREAELEHLWVGHGLVLVLGPLLALGLRRLRLQ